MAYLAAVATFACAVLLAFAALTRVQERRAVGVAKRRLEDYNLTGGRGETDQELAPLAQRLFAPLGTGLVGLAKRFAPAGYMEILRHKMVLAGRGTDREIDAFLSARVLSVLAVPGVWVLAWKFSGLHGAVLLVVYVLIGVAGLLGPDAWLNRAVTARQDAIRLRLPDVLDLLTISVEAGLGFEQALARTVSMVPGPLSDEFARMLGELRAGASRAVALSALDQRTEVAELRTFILALLQADTFGVSVGTILRTQASEMRIRRRQFAQERAQKAPVKMLFPMVFCIMPAMFVVIAGPAVINIFHAFSGK